MQHDAKDVVTAQGLLRLAGLAALLGGLLRVASAMPLPLGGQAQEAVWDLIDMLLSLGLVGVYLARAPALGRGGVVAFAAAMASFSFIGGPDADPFGFSTYQRGAAAVSLSLAALSVLWLRAKLRPQAPPLLWLGALLVGAVAGMLPGGWPARGFAVAGVCFGVGFAVAGWALLRPAPAADRV